MKKAPEIQGAFSCRQSCKEPIRATWPALLPCAPVPSDRPGPSCIIDRLLFLGNLLFVLGVFLVPCSERAGGFPASA